MTTAAGEREGGGGGGRKEVARGRGGGSAWKDPDGSVQVTDSPGRESGSGDYTVRSLTSGSGPRHRKAGAGVIS